MTLLISRGVAREMEDINAAIRAEPLAASHRLALARLRLVQGEYPKALQQLQLACQFDAGLEPEAQLVRMLVRAEQIREAVFDGKILPDLLAAAPVWLEKLISALRENGEKAMDMRQEALSEAPPSKGSYGESEPFSTFEWIADGDERLGPVIEVILGGTYYWIPFDMVESLHIPPPKRTMELVWAPVDLKLVGRPDSNIAYMPARYIPPVEGRTDALLTGTETIWQELPGGGGWQGHGRRAWYVDGEPLGMFEAGRINFEH
jgi:type VI secretion system protein ImpE